MGTRRQRLQTLSGHCVAAKLRGVDDWDERVPEIDGSRRRERVAFRADAAFARPAIYEA